MELQKKERTAADVGAKGACPEATGVVGSPNGKQRVSPAGAYLSG